MSATVTKKPEGGWLAWCEQHQDGCNAASKKTATRWADAHNDAKHEGES